MQHHRFINKIELSIESGFRQILLYGQTEDIYYLEKPDKFINIHDTLMWYFTERNMPPQSGQIILFFSRHDNDNIYAKYRPVFADDLLERPYPDGRWKDKKMKELAKEIVTIDSEYPAETAASHRWLDFFYILLNQNRVRIIVIFENIETYWRRPTIGMEMHNIVDNYLTLYRQILRRKGSLHYVLMLTSIDDISGFHINNEQIGLIKVPTPETFEAEKLYLRGNGSFDEKDILIRHLRQFPVTQSASKMLKYRRQELTLLRLKGNAASSPWKEFFKESFPKTIKDEISDKIIGQEMPNKKLLDFLNGVREEILNREKTGRQNQRLLGFRILAGPTGVGKTEYFRLLSNEAAKYGIASRIFNCTEYIEEHTISRFTGSPPGYVGSSTGEVGQHLIDNPDSIILFDEWEKAHLKIQKVFLKILEGDLTLGSGQAVDLSNVIIFFTTNAGATLLKTSTQDENHKKNIVLSSLRNRGAPPELEGRIGNSIVIFNYLSDEDAVKIIDKELKKLTDYFSKDYKKNISFNNSVNDFLLNHFQLNRRSGARDIVDQIKGLKTDIFAEVEKTDKENISVWYKADKKPSFVNPEGAIYQKEELSNLWLNALSKILEEDAGGQSPLDKNLQKIVGQEHAKSQVKESLENGKPNSSNLQYEKPTGIFLFAGPTGVGKTETFNILSSLLEKYYIKSQIFSMTEYTNETDINKLIGSSPGFVGTNVGYLGEFLLNNPYSIVCFDEFEKCHITIKQTFLGILEGKLMLGSGDRVDLSNVIIVFTTNAGNKDFIRIGTGNDDSIMDPDEHNKGVVIDSLKKDYFVPDELIGRLKQYIVCFNQISLNDAGKIINRKIDESKHTYHESVSIYLLDQFIKNPLYGARDLINNIDSIVRTDSKEHETIYVDKKGKPQVGECDDSNCYKGMELHSKERDRQISVHEIGHAVCGAELFGSSIIEDISISDSVNRMPGLTRMNFASSISTRDILFKQVCVFLAGREAERIVYSNNCSSGCSRDITEANLIVKAMVCELGMTESDLPPIDYKIISNGTIPNEYYTEMINILTEANKYTNSILKKYEKLINKLADHLIDKGIMTQQVFQEIWDKRLEYTI